MTRRFSSLPWKCMALATACLTFSATCDAQTSPTSDLVKSGTFDLPLAWGKGESQVFKTGETVGSWKVNTGTVELLDRGGKYYQDTTLPGKTLDLAGWGPGSVSQELDTQAGRRYVVSFQYSGNWWDNSFGKKTAVSIGGTTKEFVMERPASWSISAMRWQRAEFEFTATAPKSTLEFRAVQLAWHHNGMLITNVSVKAKSPSIGPAPLNTVRVPLPKDLDQFVKDRNQAIALGKALFWDMQAGSDGRTACATCHSQAGVDQRTKNTLDPGASGSAFGPLSPAQITLRNEAIAKFRGTNKTLTVHDFPFHRVKDPLASVDGNPVLFDSKEVVGSQGVPKKKFLKVINGLAEEEGANVADPVFKLGGVNTRQVTGRNTPTNLNAVFYDRLTHDGKASHFFNGANPFGDLDPNARVLKNTKKSTVTIQWQKRWYTWLNHGWWIWVPVPVVNESESMTPVKILLNNASLASQSLGPQLSDVEMIWSQRTLKDFGRKMLSLRPLAKQKVLADDSVLGRYANPTGKGMVNADYKSLIRGAFHDVWWNSNQPTADGYTQMESNFTLYWGLAIMMYQSTLVSDQTPYDRYAAGDENAINEAAKRGLKLFVNEGKCIICHGGPEFTAASVRNIREGAKLNLVTEVATPTGKVIFDTGFANIGVRPTLEDLSLGAKTPVGSFSFAQRIKDGASLGQAVVFGANDRLLADGAFKIPTLRNVELTGPYFHQGGHRTLREVVEFYARGADFKTQNAQHLSGLVVGIPELQHNPSGINDLVEFMKTLTDERVRYQRAPFDHPELLIPNGHSGVSAGVAVDEFLHIPAAGKQGGSRVRAFEEIVK